jgi:hypothetical protein
MPRTPKQWRELLTHFGWHAGFINSLCIGLLAQGGWLSASIAMSILVDFTDIWMMRKMLLNLRDRTEGLVT